MSCNDGYHSRLIDSDQLWLGYTKTRWYDVVLGTDRMVEKGLCALCGRTIVRRARVMAVAMTEACRPRVRDEAEVAAEEWDAAAAIATVPMSDWEIDAVINGRLSRETLHGLAPGLAPAEPLPEIETQRMAVAR